MFKEIYYWMTTRLSKIKSNDNPPFNAYFMICFLQGFNIETIFIVVNYFTKIHFAKNSYIYWGLLEAFILFLINYNTLYKNKNEIYEKYVKIDSKRKTKGLIFFWLYVSISIILFFVAAAYLVTPNYLQK